MDLPFRDVHEYYRIVFLRSEAQRAAQKEREEMEEKERKEQERKERAMGKAPQIRRAPPPDAVKIKNKDAIPNPTPMEAEALNDAFEDLLEGGI